MQRIDARAAPPRRAQDVRVLRTAACRQRPARPLARLAVLAVASILAWPWAVPQAEAALAARGARADARTATAGQPRRVVSPASAPVPAQPRRTRAAPPPQVGRQARPAAPRNGAAAAVRRPAPAAPRPVSAPVDGDGAPAGAAVVRALGGAARATGADPALLLAMAWKESRFDPAARNPLSSARGLMQFTDATWLETVRDFGPRHGLARHAAELSTDTRTGAISARDPRRLARLLKLRDDPRLSALMAAERIAREREGLARALGRAAAPADLYAVHLLGPAGARRFLAEMRRAPSRPALEAVGRDSVAANQNVFVARGSGRPLSLAEVHAAMASTVEEQRTARAGLLARLTAPSADRAERRGASGAHWVEVAEAR